MRLLISSYFNIFFLLPNTIFRKGLDFIINSVSFFSTPMCILVKPLQTSLDDSEMNLRLESPCSTMEDVCTDLNKISNNCEKVQIQDDSMYGFFCDY